jgi:TonB family protein
MAPTFAKRSFLLLTLCLAACQTAQRPDYNTGTWLNRSTYNPTVEVIEGECDQPPVFVEGRAPLYPPRARRDGIFSGYAAVSFTVTAEGRAIGIRLISASNPQFAAGIGEVLPSWRFKPAMLHGKPTEVRVSFRSTFEIR